MARVHEIKVRLNDNERARGEAAARLRGLTLAEFLRAMLSGRGADVDPAPARGDATPSVSRRA